MSNLRAIRVFTACVVCLVLATASLPAGTVHWTNGGTGNWSVGTNWHTGLPPGAGDYAYVRNGGTAEVDQAVTPIGFLYLSAIANNVTGHIVVNAGGDLQATRLYMANGTNAVGTLTINTGGSVTFSSYARLAVYDAGDGRVLVDGGTLNFAGDWLKMGGNGYGELKMTGGSITGNRMDIGGDSGALNGTGVIIIEGGAFSASVMHLGYRNIGQLEISGGSLDAGALRMGYYNTAEGTLRVVGSQATSIMADELIVGQASPGKAIFEFILDDGGVTPIDIDGTADFGNGLSTVDITIGEDTPGGDWTLFVADDMVNANTVDVNIEMLGSARYFTSRWTTVGNRRALELTTDQMPEPVTIMGLLMGSAGVVGYLRRRRAA